MVQRMLGNINNLSKFVAALAEKTLLLHQLIKKDSVFKGSDNSANEREQLCKCLGGQPLLTIFNPQRDTKITSDASQNGISLALLQQHGKSWKPLANASHVFTATQEMYSQIGKEAMAVVAGCEKFHHFPYGCHVILEAEGCPLVPNSQ